MGHFVAPSSSRLRVMRGGQAMVRAWKIPKPIVLVDSREQMPLYLFENHPNWFGGERRVALNAGDYSVEGMENVLSLERKSMADAIGRTMAGRERFISSCARLGKFRWKAILIEASYEDMKTPYYKFEDLVTEAHPNAVCGTLDAIEAKFGIPILYSSRNRNLASEKAASWLSKHFTYWWLEQNGHDRMLIDTDGL
jgi:ERCC4-type nuclease